MAVGFVTLGLSTRLWATSSRLILRSAVHSASMLAQSLLAQSDSSARTGCSSCWKVAIRSSSYPRRPARLHQSLSWMWLESSPLSPPKSSFSTFSLVWRGRSKQGSSSMVTTVEGHEDDLFFYSNYFLCFGGISVKQIVFFIYLLLPKCERWAKLFLYVFVGCVCKIPLGTLWQCNNFTIKSILQKICEENSHKMNENYICCYKLC